MSFMAEITKQLNKLSEFCNKHNPDVKSNTGNLLGQAFFWSKIENYAKGKKDEAWELLAKEDIADIEACKEYDQGEYSLCESQSFVATAKVSNPVKRFDENVLAKALQAKYRVPLPTSKEMIAAAKVPTKPQVTKSIVER